MSWFIPGNPGFGGSGGNPAPAVFAFTVTIPGGGVIALGSQALTNGVEFLLLPQADGNSGNLGYKGNVSSQLVPFFPGQTQWAPVSNLNVIYVRGTPGDVIVGNGY